MENINVKTYIKDAGPFDIIGDIHGCYEELILLIEKLGYKKDGQIYMHPQKRKLVSIGDLNDRGPKNLQVIYLWMEMVERECAFYVPGNHCNKFYRYIIGRKVKIGNGLEDTIREYEALSKQERERFKNRYRKFYENQAPYWVLDQGRLLVSHAGMKQEWIGRNDTRVQSFCLYGDTTGETDEAGHPIRRDWAKTYTGTTCIVYGQTPIVAPMVINNTVNIDQGCVFGGNLTALQYPEMEFVQVYSKQLPIEEQMERMVKKYHDYKGFVGKG